MQSYSLEINDFCCSEYKLISIHTPLNDYKIAYLLNKHLGIKLYRAKYDLDFENNNNKSSYPVFEFEDKELDSSWFLITNVFKEKRQTNESTLFSESFVKTYLIPEKKKVDYFLKIEGDFEYEYFLKTVEKIKKIPQIATSYILETDTLKSKENLIF